MYHTKDIDRTQAAASPTAVARIGHAITMSVVCALSLLLLIYVGFGEARRTYEQFQIEKLVAQGRVAQTAMETFLRAGLPLREYVGFSTLADPMLASDSSIIALAALDPQGRPVFSTGEAIPLLNANDPLNAPGTAEVRETTQFIQAILPLRNKFETVGHIAITTPWQVVNDILENAFHPLVGLAVGLSLAFGLFVFIGAPRFAGAKSRWLQVGYAAVFLAMSATVIGTLLTLYAGGAQSKTQALADSLGQRVRDIAAFNLNLEDFDGLDRMFDDYRNLNPEISSAALTVGGRIVIHTDRQLVGKNWQSDSRSYEYVIDLAAPGDRRDIKVAVTLPGKVIYDKVARSAKNFAALFLASAFLAGLFLQLATSLHGGRLGGAGAKDGEVEDRLVKLVKPVFFVGVFVEHLSYGFLPQFIQEAKRVAGLPPDYISIPFTLYYLCFALTLIPAGRFSAANGPRRLMYGGLLLVTASLLAMTMPLDFWSIVAARAAAGVGQAMLFIGVQSYILAMASPEKRTQGASIIVFGFQGGMISGAAIGSLLVVYIGAQSVFMVGAVISVLMAIYAFGLVPPAPAVEPASDGPSRSPELQRSDFGQIFRSFEFMRTIALVGLPAKAVMTGIVFFAMPLLLAQMKYAPEDIGQIIMLYAVCVLVASTYVSRQVDRAGSAFLSLVLGAVVSGAGLILIGMSGQPGLAGHASADLIRPAMLLAGVVTVGLAHGLINAPIISHIADTELAGKIGASAATASYRFLERVGHVAGPIMVGQLFLAFGQSASVTLWVGAAIVMLGLAFMLHTPPRRMQAKRVGP